ncbi:MAG: cation diffusion facilitator family transporter [Clostridia bacterium]|nr:cation diffusion facilitator family transporter [Clostridia bacterium]
MKTEKNILVAFLLNLAFSLFELVGGIFTKSVAILSDSVHDFGDALSIGISYFLEKKSRTAVDEAHTYGYLRYSVLGGLITTVILILGSGIMMKESIARLFHPVDVDYRGMLVLAVIGVVVNLVAAFVTREGDSLNQKSVNLHMLEDVLGWAVVLVGAVVMCFTDIGILDSLMSIGVAAFILVCAVKNLVEIANLFLEKTPADVDVAHLKEELLGVDGVQDIHHLHIRSMDGAHHYATFHVVTDSDDLPALKAALRAELAEHHIVHAVIETETERCDDVDCHPVFSEENGHHHHHHH